MENLPQYSCLLRQKGGFAPCGAEKLQRQSQHLATRFMGLRNWIIDEKVAIDHDSIKG